MVLIIAGLEISMWKFNTPPQPLLFGFAAGCLTVNLAARIAIILPEFSVLKRESQARESLRKAINEICSRGWLLEKMSRNYDGLWNCRELSKFEIRRKLGRMRPPILRITWI